MVVDAPRIDGHAFVGSEDRRGARLAVEHLLALGHGRFALLTTSAVHQDRLAGYREALEAAGVERARSTSSRPTCPSGGSRAVASRSPPNRGRRR